MNANTCLLVVPPMSSVLFPALGLPLLKANLNKNGFHATILNTNFLFAQKYSFPLQMFLSEPISFLCDVMFSHALFERPDEYLNSLADTITQTTPDAIDLLKFFFPSLTLLTVLKRLSNIGHDFGKMVAVKIVDNKPWIVGISSMMNDNPFALYLIREIKQLNPEIITLMGGVNCDGEMGVELFSKFKEIDYICQYDADKSLIELVTNLKKTRPLLNPIPGILCREHPFQDCKSPNPLTSDELEALPDPDFSDHIHDIEVTLKQFPHIRKLFPFGFPAITMETSRGCWWGQKHRCSFCGLNPRFAAYSSKSGVHAFNQMKRLVKRYRPKSIMLMDNLPNREYLKSFWKHLADESLPTAIITDTIGAVTRYQMELLSHAGVSLIQAGIESLSDESIKAMGKPTTPIRSIATLKWCATFGIYPTWSFLYGLPGERPEEADNIRLLVDKINHLCPPIQLDGISLTRYSKYYESPKEFGLNPILTEELQLAIFPFPEDSVRRLSTFFDSEYFRNWRKSKAWHEMIRVIGWWWKVRWRSHLVYARRREGAFVIDTRPKRKQLLHKLSPIEAMVCEVCEKPKKIKAIYDYLDTKLDKEQISDVLENLIHNNILLLHNDYLLNLAIEPTKDYYRASPINTTTKILPKISLSQLWRTGRVLGVSRFSCINSLIGYVIFKILAGFIQIRWFILSKWIVIVTSLLTNRKGNRI